MITARRGDFKPSARAPYTWWQITGVVERRSPITFFVYGPSNDPPSFGELMRYCGLDFYPEGGRDRMTARRRVTCPRMAVRLARLHSCGAPFVDLWPDVVSFLERRRRRLAELRGGWPA